MINRISVFDHIRYTLGYMNLMWTKWVIFNIYHYKILAKEQYDCQTMKSLKSKCVG